MISLCYKIFKDNKK
ncbi:MULTISPECIES: hypothetical protein [unclassified Facklamia]|nr:MULTISPECIES: hypothetical protein [unclassified Facklamia]